VERFGATLTSAFCFYVALGRSAGVCALQAMALLVEDNNSESRVRHAYKQIADYAEAAFKDFDLASLEARGLFAVATLGSKAEALLIVEGQKAVAVYTESPSSSKEGILQPQS